MKLKDKAAMDIRNEIQVKKFVLIVAILVGLLIILTVFVKIPIYFDSPFILIFCYVSLAPILIYIVGIMFRPWIAFVICALGSVLGIWLDCLIFRCGIELPIYLITILIAHGLEGPIISKYREKKKEMVAMFIGCAWEFFWLGSMGLIWYTAILGWSDISGFAYVAAYTMIIGTFSLFFIPIAYYLNKGIRVKLNIKNFDEFLHKKESNN